MPTASRDYPAQTTAIPAITPHGAGHRFVWYGDCCVVSPDHPNTANFAAVNAVFRRLDTMPDHVVFAGDNIMGMDADADEHRRQWRSWLDEAMAWFWPHGIPIYQTTSNHNTFNAVAEAVFRETFPDIPRNGPPGQEGLSYWVRRGDLLLVFVNTNFSGLGGSGHVEADWLDAVLTEQRDAAHKLVIGHHPMFAVNGYAQSPGWCVVPDEGRTFWAALVRHGVLAYLCSHILAFDVQVREGVLQVLTGGAGTYGMALGLMPEDPEYLHLVMGAIDAKGLRYQVLDTDGVAREWLRWPLPAPADTGWKPLDPAVPPAKPASAGRPNLEGSAWLLRLRLRGTTGKPGGEQTLLAGWQSWEGPEALWFGLVGNPLHVTAQLVPEAGRGAQVWAGPEVAANAPFDLEVAIHGGMGPGGVLCRVRDGPWSSLESSSARGAELMSWPEAWAVGHGQSGPADRPFHGTGLSLDWRIDEVTLASLFDR
jgi:hypothetical protein